MNKSTYEAIVESASFIEDYLAVEEQLTDIAARAVADAKAKKTLKRIVKVHQAAISEFKPQTATAMMILQILSKKGLTAEELAPKVGKSVSYVKQTLQALRKGGIQFTVTGTDEYRATGRLTNVWGHSGE